MDLVKDEEGDVALPYDLRYRKRRTSSISTDASEGRVAKKRRPSVLTDYQLSEELKRVLPKGVYFHEANQVSYQSLSGTG